MGDGVQPGHRLVHRQEQPLDQFHQGLPAEAVVPRRFHRSSRTGPSERTRTLILPRPRASDSERYTPRRKGERHDGHGSEGRDRLRLRRPAGHGGRPRRGRRRGVVGQGQAPGGLHGHRRLDGPERGDGALREAGECQPLHSEAERRDRRGPLPEIPGRAPAGPRGLRKVRGGAARHREEGRVVQRQADALRALVGRWVAGPNGGRDSPRADESARLRGHERGRVPRRAARRLQVRLGRRFRDEVRAAAGGGHLRGGGGRGEAAPGGRT